MTAGVIAVAGGLGKFYAATVPASSLVTPGVLGFLVFAALAVALVFLLRSMNKQFRKITPPPAPEPGGEGAGDEGAGDEAVGTEARDTARTPE